ncbi:MAG TPA: hypothetical protein H9830_10395 [Candidatus Agrococcus pullicola]|uniref:Thioredoxin-like fold domain-containing protein n=1 Tax=Candidatus Agrococcus pullicola TaxID=2838429 RepID=A0A9D1YZ85_9MICO|nr:hypothetical protein [Candidatus Agrococcus pullicola]
MAVSATAVLCLSACAGEATEEFDSVEDLVAAYHAAGGQCEDFVIYDEAGGEEAEVAHCGVDTVLSLTESDDQTSDVATGAMLRGQTVLVGAGWVIEDPDAVALREELGGAVLALQEGGTPESVEDDAFVFGEGEPRIQVVVDPLCDYCNRFIETNGDALIELADSGEATVEYRVVSLHDHPENDFGSSYGVNALACAADADIEAFRPLLSTVLAGPSDEAWTELELVEAAEQAGADAGDCIADGTFLFWTMQSTQDVLQNGLPDGENLGGVPYISIDGVPYAQDVTDPDAFLEAVAAAE